ncbi:AraC-type DNA-binding protein [Mucilaginibacter mallensis]|uniref:AraC-type DNA-binding protein n=1 Tax=Mucilaginibacter mallensis TaxID=652787 RepID=A0A1H2BKA4_MUCMA|nr:helix-turn-helix transcriptional regulator [Mucilaginibacter mallensis]SDT58608.1 AraC-type DNA-binding protein [Mucilaginibacter mallensis]
MKRTEKPYTHILADKDIKDSFSINYWDARSFEAEPHYRSTYNRVFLIKAGEGGLQIDGTTYLISANDLFLISKGQVYNFNKGAVISGYEISFGDCFWEKAPASANNCKAVLFNNTTTDQQVAVSNADLTDLTVNFNHLHAEYVKDDYINKPDVLAAYLKIIMIKIANLNALLTKGSDSYENKLYREFLYLVNNKYQSTHEVADFARELGITTRKLTDLCNRCSGKGAKDIINGQLIAEAKRSLQFSAKTIKEVAYQLNFSTPDQFSHFFKKNTQLSPHQYRGNFAQIGM